MDDTHLFQRDDIIIPDATEFATFTSCVGESGGVCRAPFIVTNANEGEVIDFNTIGIPSRSYIFALNSFFTAGTYHASNLDGTIIVTNNDPAPPVLGVPEPGMIGLSASG